MGSTVQGVDREFVLSFLPLLGYVDVHSEHLYMYMGRPVTAYKKYGYDQFVLRKDKVGMVNTPVRWAFVYAKKTHITDRNTGNILFKGRHDEAVKYLKTHPYTKEKE